MSDKKRYEFRGELVKGSTGSFYVLFPYDVLKEFGTKRTIRIKVWFESEPERKSLLPRGDGTHWISISYPVRTRLGLGEGDYLQVVVEQDLDPRTVEIPEDVEWLLDNDPELKTVFLKQSWFNQKFFMDWITQAASPDVRVNRINRTFEWLEMHKKGKISKLPGNENETALD
ncbi:MAG TPA: YdeI/OmpD-associated family protein [Prolixibacteraceae bacterium]|nr:YdeI/OmpD-associated family protein [Prolixibacteraceae bacterium]